MISGGIVVKIYDPKESWTPYGDGDVSVTWERGDNQTALGNRESKWAMPEVRPYPDI